jgi:hypothetical protein
MEALGGEEIQLLLILDLSNRWDDWSVPRIGRHLAPGKDPKYPLDRRLSGPQSRSGHMFEEKSAASAGNLTPFARSSTPKSDIIMIKQRRLLNVLTTFINYQVFGLLRGVLFQVINTSAMLLKRKFINVNIKASRFTLLRFFERVQFSLPYAIPLR